MQGEKHAAGRSLRGLGWLLFIGGVIGVVGLVGYALLADTEVPVYVKVILGAVYGGLAVLLLAVLRQRLAERKTDKYDDVQI